MSNIRVDLGYTIKDGTEIKFRSPVDCSAITGLIVYYPAADGNTTSKVFALADAHGNNVGNIDNLFAEDVVVKVILDVTKSMAFVQNADTNAYLEGRFAETIPVSRGGTGATTEANARKNLHVLFSTPLIASSNHTGFVIVGDSSQKREILVKIKMVHQNGYSCEVMFPINTQTGAPVASVCQHSGTLGFTSFQYKTDGNTTSYSIKYNVSGIYAYGSLEVLTFFNTKSGHDGEIALKLDAYMSFSEVTDGTPMEIEWANPHMYTNGEYRLTERWNSYPVYTRLIYVGKFPAPGSFTWKQFGTDSGITRIIRVQGVSDAGQTVPYDGDGTRTAISGIMVDGNPWLVLSCASGSADMTARTCYAQVWYVKE